jgi:hypothetical protein
MPDCPYCLENVKVGAKKCPHCQTSLDKDEDGNVVYILDRGLVRFGKFIIAVLGAFLIVGVYVYGLDLKDAVERTSKAELDVQRALNLIEQHRNELDQKAAKLDGTIAQVEKIKADIDSRQKEIDKTDSDAKLLLSSIRAQKELAFTLVTEFQHRTLDANEQSVAESSRDVRGIDKARGNLWKVGAIIHFAFLDGDDKVKEIVRSAIAEWRVHVNLKFVESEIKDAEIRISFADPGSSWSMIGTDALGVAKTEPTMNYGTLQALADSAVTQVALHEFGHAIGLQHEFQNPSAGGIFNREAVHAYGQNALGWSRPFVDAAFAPLKKGAYPGSRPYDKYSVMNYSLPAEVFKDLKDKPEPSAHLSESDKEYISTLYPSN